jgi:hypothetical protein
MCPCYAKSLRAGVTSRETADAAVVTEKVLTNRSKENELRLTASRKRIRLSQIYKLQRLSD